MERPTEKWETLKGETGLWVSRDHTFGADALLLADFARPGNRERVCDLGTGCGILPFYWWAERLPTGAGFSVDGVDISPEAIDLARRSLARLEEGATTEIRMRFHLADWDDLPDSSLPAGSYDRVTCNPPYFAYDGGKKSETRAARVARHEPDGQMLPRLAAVAARLLKNGGRFCLCHRPERLCDLFVALRGSGLEPKRLQFVQGEEGKAPWLLLCEAKKGGRSGLTIVPPRIIGR